MSEENVLEGAKFVIKRVFTVPVEKVYQAWTQPEQMAKWFSSNSRWKSPIVDTELQSGGRHNITMRHSDGDAFHVVGHYLEIVPNERISFTWKFLEGAMGQEESIVTIEFRAITGGTELTLTHEKITDPTERANTLEGWNGCLDMLDGYFSGVTLQND